MSFAALAITFFVTFGLMNYYVIRRTWQALAGTGLLRVIVLVIFFVFLAALFYGRSLAMRHSGLVPEIVIAAASFYFEGLILLVLFTALVDLARLADHFVPYFPAAVRANGQGAARVAFLAVAGMTLAFMAAGFIHSHRLKTTPLEVAIDKKAGPLQTLNAVVLSDLHVGPFLHAPRLRKIVEAVNALNPDVVLIAGDIVNEDTHVPELERMAQELRRIRSRWGVFACTGNHEYFAGIEKSLKYLRESGIRVLLDETVLVAEAFYVAGRTNQQYLGNREKRPALPEVLAGTDHSKPVILLDHQPVRLFEAEEASVDLQLSGHTHGGEIIPIVWINNLLWEIGRGYGRKGATQYYVTDGVGVWGLPGRIGTRSEIVHLRISFR
jgi:predicted MPP superfamily phosphohydrolase